MSDLLQRAEEVFEQLTVVADRVPHDCQRHCAADHLRANLNFDTSKECTPDYAPMTKGEEQRREWMDRGKTMRQFLAELNISVEDARDPDAGNSVMDTSSAGLPYDRDREDRAYRIFCQKMKSYYGRIDFLKETTILTPDLFDQCEQLQRIRTFLNETAEVSNLPGDAQHFLELYYSTAHQNFLKHHREVKNNLLTGPKPLKKFNL